MCPPPVNQFTRLDKTAGAGALRGRSCNAAVRLLACCRRRWFRWRQRGPAARHLRLCRRLTSILASWEAAALLLLLSLLWDCCSLGQFHTCRCCGSSHHLLAAGPVAAGCSTRPNKLCLSDNAPVSMGTHAGTPDLQWMPSATASPPAERRRSRPPRGRAAPPHLTRSAWPGAAQIATQRWLLSTPAPGPCPLQQRRRGGQALRSGRAPSGGSSGSHSSSNSSRSAGRGGRPPPACAPSSRASRSLSTRRLVRAPCQMRPCQMPWRAAHMAMCRAQGAPTGPSAAAAAACRRLPRPAAACPRPRPPRPPLHRPRHLPPYHLLRAGVGCGGGRCSSSERRAQPVGG